MKEMSVEIFLAVVLVFSLFLPKDSWSKETFQEKPAGLHVQYIERAAPAGEGVTGMPEMDWYDNAFEDYEKSPYGYYEEEEFYGDFDLDYWQSDSREDWYERRFYEYGRGYLIP
ncbi:MAG: hypothetical protein C4576_22670 [Desulfobacteraceae bacterium]|nr:MAG: hypothetical protein C4576_22670 [Desulfobacteraceae bacterium]